MMKRFLIAVGVITGLVSMLIYLGFLRYNSNENEDSTSLFVQEIVGSDLLLVYYDVWYGGGEYASGYTLLKTIEDFDFREVDKLPFSHIKNVSSKRIDGFSFLKPKENALTVTSQRIENIEINTTFYKRHQFLTPCELVHYRFSTFKETKDSLFLFGLERKYEPTISDPAEMVFRKGNIKIHTDTLGQFYNLEIEELVIVEQRMLLNDGSSVLGTDSIEGWPVACLRTYYMNPSSVISLDEFSDYGFLKELK